VFEFKLPDLGEGIQEGEILHWHVAVGDRIEEDDPLVEVETDKAAVTIPSPKGGKVVSLTGDVGQSVPVGTVIVVIDESAAAEQADQSASAPVKGGEPAPAAKLQAVPAAACPAKQEAERPRAQLSVVAPEPGSGRTPVPAAPATRRLARELGVDLARVPASGPGGRVTSDDVQRFAAGENVVPSTVAAPVQPRRPLTETEELPAIPAGGGDSGVPFFELERLPDFEQWGPVQREAVRSIRRKVARKMVASMTIVPHVAHMDEADVTELDAFRRQERKRLEGQEVGRLTLLAFVIKAAVAQLKSRPQFNASLDPHRQEIIYKQFYNVGFAADTD
jgi:pyruvate dehydrogenase E2 component (dihydrolipoamide acetyltransferase)